MNDITIKEKLIKALISKGFKAKLLKLISENKSEIEGLDNIKRVEKVADLSYSLLPKVLKLGIRHEKFIELFVEYSGALKITKIIKKAFKLNK